MGDTNPVPQRLQKKIILSMTLMMAIFAIVEVSQNYLRAGLWTSPFSWTEAAIEIVPSWVLVALMIAPIVALACRFKVEHPHLLSRLSLHITASFIFSVLHLAAMAGLLILRFPSRSFSIAVRKLAMMYLVYDVITYGAIVVATYAVLYYVQSKERELAALNLERSLTEARLQALRGQLNPHFLFNTLNAISTLALKRDFDGVVETLARLSDLLRTTLDERMPQRVSLEKELELIDLYMSIQKTRFGERLHFEIDVQDSAKKAIVPFMLLQPLVENAVIHGTSRSAGGGDVRIEARMPRASRLEIAVSNSGPPCDERLLLDGKGIGVRNVRERLDRLYPNRHQFRVERHHHDERTVITIELPWEESDVA